MANTIDSSIFIQEVTEKVIGALRKVLINFRAFSTDVSAQAVSDGARTIIVPLVGDPTAQDHTGDYRDNINTTDDKVSVVLSQHKTSNFHLTDLERMEIADSVWGPAALAKVEGAVFAVGKSILDYIFALILNADYAAKTVCLPADFDSDFVGAQRTYANQNGFGRNRSIIIGSDYTEVLAGDPQLANNFALADANPMLEGKIARAKGFNIIEYDNIPTNSESLKGIIVEPRALAVAIRPIVVSEPDEMLQTTVITDADSGLSMTFSIWYDRATRKRVYNVEAKFGATKAKTTALRRITSA